MISCGLCGAPVSQVRPEVDARTGGWALLAPCGHRLDVDTAGAARRAGLVGSLPRVDGAALIAAERTRQRREEGHSDAADAERPAPELAWMAWALIDAALHQRLDRAKPMMWPQDRPWRPGKTPVRALVIAGALIAAEIDRRLARGERP